MDAASHRRIPVGAYVGAWVVLVALTGLTWGLAQLDLGAVNTPVALLIAAVKALLIAFVFMHLIRPERVHRFILMASVLFVVLLIGMLLIESQSRFPLATPPGSSRYSVPWFGQLG